MHFHKQRYAKSIQQIGNFFGTIVGTRKLFFKKTPKREALVINTFRLLYAPFYSNIYKSSAQKQQNAEDTALQYIEA
jgi:hypothetical protein